MAALLRFAARLRLAWRFPAIRPFAERAFRVARGSKEAQSPCAFGAPRRRGGFAVDFRARVRTQRRRGRDAGRDGIG